jgi:DMSO/TMAO reductase YedYZ molybdopterin-dependent catalytic subunit
MRRAPWDGGLVAAGIAVLLAAGWTTAPIAQSSTGTAKPVTPMVAAPTALAVAGDVPTPLMLSATDLKALPRTKVEVTDEGRVVTYEGVLVGEILKKAGVALGADLRGDAVATYVTASAADGYRVVFSLPELDNGFTSNDILVADTIDGQPLFAYQGPWRIVAPKDLRGARSIRMLERLEVVRLRR